MSRRDAARTKPVWRTEVPTVYVTLRLEAFVRLGFESKVLAQATVLEQIIAKYLPLRAGQFGCLLRDFLAKWLRVRHLKHVFALSIQSLRSSTESIFL